MDGEALIVPATISSEIVVRVDDLPSGQIDLLKAATTFRNEDRDKAERLKTFGFWDLPETIALWREERRRGGEHVLCLPRGFAAQLAGGLASAGHSVRWDDQRSTASATQGYFRPFLLRWYQWPFVADLMRAEQGVGEAPTSSGKTVSALAMMANLQQRSIVIVDKSTLLDQWRERAAEFLGLSMDLNDERSVGMIGQDVWVERDLTVCLRQTLSSRQWQTDAISWGATWGLCILDEIHHLGSAQTLMDVVRALPCRYMIGLSATPARTDTQGSIIGSLVGPLVARIDNQALIDEGIVIDPVVRVVETDFKMDFWPTHDSDADGECQKPDCKKTTQHSHKDNWQACLKALVEDQSRNKMIAEQIVCERGHVHLVFARQKKHLKLIREALAEAGWDGPIYDLTGKQNADGESQEISRAIEAGGFWELDVERKKATKGKEIVYRKVADSPSGLREAVILSTVADEGVDIPPIDRVHVVYPLRQRVATIQLVGRGTRSADGKRGCVVVDYNDLDCGVFAEQHQERMRTYRFQGLRVESRILAGGGIASDGRSGDSAANPSVLTTDAPSPTEDVIEWWSFPERNEVWYRHLGCDETYPWMIPHDGEDPRSPDDECADCCQVRPLVERARTPERLVLICGSRDWTDSMMVRRYVVGLYHEALRDGVWLVVMHGGAGGADALSSRPARNLGIEVRVVEPDWSMGKVAGLVRNSEMLDKKPDRVGAFSLGTSGTQDTIDGARERGIPVDLHGHGGLVVS